MARPLLGVRREVSSASAFEIRYSSNSHAVAAPAWKPRDFGERLLEDVSRRSLAAKRWVVPLTAKVEIPEERKPCGTPHRTSSPPQGEAAGRGSLPSRPALLIGEDRCGGVRFARQFAEIDSPKDDKRFAVVGRDEQFGAGALEIRLDVVLVLRRAARDESSLAGRLCRSWSGVLRSSRAPVDVGAVLSEQPIRPSTPKSMAYRLRTRRGVTMLPAPRGLPSELQRTHIERIAVVDRTQIVPDMRVDGVTDRMNRAVTEDAQEVAVVGRAEDQAAAPGGRLRILERQHTADVGRQDHVGRLPSACSRWSECR